MFRGFHFFFQMSMKYDKKYFAFMVLNQAALAVGAVNTRSSVLAF